jgi:protein toll
LGGNPYNCTCESRPLFNFIKNQGSKVLDLDAVRMQCDRDERKLWQIEKLEEFCTTGLSTAEVGGIVAVLVLLCIVIVLLVLWTCYSEHLTIWVYSKPCFRVLFTEDLIDQDKPYDVFLSYSHEDEAWVEQVLAAGLENPSEGGEGMQYRCCIHTRDWKVGEMIPDQIIQSVESSRRTLIVLSKAYVDSMWTKLEFRAAHTQALQDKTQRVILVVRDQDVIADKESMEEDLQRYISLNTYLDCKDPWFWQKLRYALPHRGGFRGRKRTRRETDRMELMRSQAELELGKRSPSPRVLDSKALQKEQPTSAVAG